MKTKTTYQHAKYQLERSGQHCFPADGAREPVERLLVDMGADIVCRVVGELDCVREFG